MTDLGVYFVDSEGGIIGSNSYDNINLLPWHKRVLCKVIKRYRDKHIFIEPIKVQSYGANYKIYNKNTDFKLKASKPYNYDSKRDKIRSIFRVSTLQPVRRLRGKYVGVRRFRQWRSNGV